MQNLNDPSLPFTDEKNLRRFYDGLALSHIRARALCALSETIWRAAQHEAAFGYRENATYQEATRAADGDLAVVRAVFLFDELEQLSCDLESMKEVLRAAAYPARQAA